MITHTLQFTEPREFSIDLEQDKENSNKYQFHDWKVARELIREIVLYKVNSLNLFPRGADFRCKSVDDIHASVVRASSIGKFTIRAKIVVTLYNVTNPEVTWKEELSGKNYLTSINPKGYTTVETQEAKFIEDIEKDLSKRDYEMEIEIRKMQAQHLHRRGTDINAIKIDMHEQGWREYEDNRIQSRHKRLKNG